MLYLWLRAFVFTQIVEAPVYRRLLGTSWPASLLPTTLTHPVVWFVFPLLGDLFALRWTTTMTLAEVFAWIAEVALLARRHRRVSLPRALFASLVANGLSLSLCLLCRELFGAP